MATISYLSPNVESLLCEVRTIEYLQSSAEQRTPNNTKSEISFGLIDDWSLITDLFDRYCAETDALQLIHHMKPLIYQLTCDLNQLSTDKFISHCSGFLNWMVRPDAVVNAFSTLKLDHPCRNIYILLGLTADLEQSLGNIHLTRAKSCPNMLKDLLTSDILSDIIGRPMVQLMQLFVGAKSYLNLRNLAWHGFLCPNHEVPAYCIQFLIVCVVNIGHRLCEQSFAFKMRDRIDFTSYFSFDGSEGCYMDFLSDTNHFGGLCALLTSHSLISTNALFHSHYIYLEQCLKDQKYSDCVMLMFPLLENLLRIHFCEINDTEQRLLTAENTVLFTTFDEILAHTLENGSSNKLIVDILPSSLTTAFYDLLIYRNGPRIRDRISHGEASWDSVTAIIVNATLTLLTGSLLSNPKYIGDILQNESVIQLNVSFTKWLDGYQSLFHPLAILKKKAIQLSSYFKNLFSTCTTCSISISDCILSSLICDELLCVLNKESSNGFLDFIFPHYLNKKLQVLFKKAEPATTTSDVLFTNLISLFQRTLDNTLTILFQIQSVWFERQTQLEQRQLRSRQRQNLERLSLGLPLLCIFCRLLLSFVCEIIHQEANLLHSIDQINSDQWKQLVTTEQITDKIISLSEKCKWDEIVLCIKKFGIYC